ncbi:MAG TPA: hypothetical protein VHF22_15550 [Planctomycetota bacterium]|nr:hypothetical protein [Planctomycetota bacterium]
MSNVNKVNQGGNVGYDAVVGEGSAAEAPAAQADTATVAAPTSAQVRWASGGFAAATLQANLGVGASATVEAAKPSVTDRVLGWFSSSAHDVADAASGLKAKTAALGSAVAGGVKATLGKAADEASGAAARLETLATGAKDEIAGEARSIGHDLVSAGGKAEKALAQGFNQVVTDAKKAGRAVEEKTLGILNDAAGLAARIKDKGREILGAVEDAMDTKKNIEKLKTDGSTLTIALGANAEVEVEGKAKGEVEITRKDDEKTGKPKYEVKVTGEVGAGLVLELGGKAGAEATAGGKAEASLKGSFTFECDSPGEAARVAGIAGKMALAGGVQASIPGIGTLAGMALAPGKDDMKFLADHAESMELGGEAAASLTAELGIGGDKDALRALGADASVGAKVEQSVELKFPRNGEPAKITVKRGFEVNGELSAGVGGAVGAKLGAESTLGVEVEQEFTLPKSVDLKALRDHPLETVKDVAGEIAKDSEATVTLKSSLKSTSGLKLGGEAGKGVELGGESAGALGEVDTEVSFKANPAKLGAAFAAGVKAGSLQKALQALDRNVEVEGKVEGKSFSGFHLSPEIRIAGVGIGVEAQYERADNRKLREFKGSPSEVWKQMQGVKAEPRETKEALVVHK